MTSPRSRTTPVRRCACGASASSSSRGCCCRSSRRRRTSPCHCCSQAAPEPRRGARRIGQLSGGQAQRVAIARALGAGPSIVFADEPTGALDSQTADEVLDALLATGRGPDRALILVTHDARVAERCDRIVRLRDGRIMADERSDGPGNVRSDAQDARPFAGRTEASR